MRGALLLGALQAVNFLIVAVNMRAVAHARYLWVALTDLAICALNFTIIKRVAEASTVDEFVGYAIGGVCGALAGVWLSRHWKDGE